MSTIPYKTIARNIQINANKDIIVYIIFPKKLNGAKAAIPVGLILIASDITAA